MKQKIIDFLTYILAFIVGIGGCLLGMVFEVISIVIGFIVLMWIISLFW
jgi:hypothetical protein